MNVDQFLDLYKELEESLRKRYQGARLTSSSVVMHFMNTPEGRQYKEDLDTCREMRNLLAHRTDIKGKPPLIPAAGAIAALREIIDYVNRPPLALEFATPGDKIFCARRTDNARATMRRMTELGFSHVPVLDRGKLLGIFSISTVFSYALDGNRIIDENTTIADFSPYLPVKNHATEDFLFVDPSTDLWEIREKLGRPQPHSKKRLAAIFVTKNGSPNAPLLGMITPWDVLGEIEDNE